jgi:hypothetical protein
MKDTGGPAFPTTTANYNGMDPAGEGMTLRDYFAAKSMQAEMTDGINESDFAWTAARAYKMADAMLAERSKT